MPVQNNYCQLPSSRILSAYRNHLRRFCMEFTFRISPGRLTTLFVTVALLAGIGRTQIDTDHWLRVLTEDTFLIDVNRTSLVIESENVISAKFRTRSTASEPLPGNSGLRYKDRIDHIQFSIGDGRYRVASSLFLDSEGNVALSVPTPADWNTLRSRSKNLLYSAARQLQPFGFWKVSSYRFASGESAAADDPTELKSLVGTRVHLNLFEMSAGKETCRDPVFTTGPLTAAEFTIRTGASLNSIGIVSERVDAIFVKCVERGKLNSTSILIKRPDQRILMLWGGVFLELERTPNAFNP